MSVVEVIKAKAARYKTAVNMAADELCQLNPGFRRDELCFEIDWTWDSERGFNETLSRAPEWLNRNFNGVCTRLIDNDFQIRIRIDDYQPSAARFKIEFFKHSLDEQTTAEIVGILMRR